MSVSACTDSIEQKPSCTSHRVLICGDVDPTSYVLKILVKPEGDFRFEGILKLHCVVTRAGVTSVTLHSKELEYKTCEFHSNLENAASPSYRNFTLNSELSTVTFEFDDELPQGPGVIQIAYSGLHNNQMAGFYRSEYTGRNGAKSVMLSTQFEALDARRCFPCIDEPARKATFKATLVVKAGQTALSNMPVQSETLSEDGCDLTVVFDETPKMSTYLLAFAVCDFDYTESIRENGVKIRVYTPPGSRSMGSFALGIAVKTLDFFDDVFGENYPLPKLDMIAVPQFAMGAMENWGLVTYREVDLLIDNEKASSTQKQRVASVVAHELAHQWFGNLVTMTWWNGLWLNEGFATFMQDYCVDHIYPDWLLPEQFLTNSQAMAMKLDSLVSSHPIEVPIAHAEEVEQVFDHISYHKGASVVRLIYSFLGSEKFKCGLRKYMNEYKYKNAETEDLWKVWEDVSGLPVKNVMAAWTEQMGFPLITVQKIEWASDYSTCTLHLEQKWFIADGSEPEDGKGKVWSIPLMASVEGDNVNLGVMETRTHKVEICTPGSPRPKWIKLNAGQNVPMRVHYGAAATQMSPLFENAILTRTMSSTDRIGILLDAFALTKAGIVDPGELVSLLRSFKNEKSMPVFSAIEGVLGSLNSVLKSVGGNFPNLHPEFVRFARGIIKNAVTDIGWDARETDTHLDKMLRTCLIRLQTLFMADVADVLTQAKKRFDDFVSDSVNGHERLPSEIKTSVLKIVLSNSTDNDAFNKCMDILLQAKNSQEKKDIYLSIGYVNNDELKLRTMDWCTRKDNLKLQDFFYPIASVSSSNAKGQEIAWSYLQNNFNRIIDMIRTASPSLLAVVVESSCGGFASNEKALEIETFFESHRDTEPISLMTRKLDQIVENTRANAKLVSHIQNSSRFLEIISSTD